MDLQLTCPTCAAVFAPATDVRGKKTQCPKCNASLIVTSAGVAKAGEQRRPAPAQPSPARRWNPLWFLLAVPLILLPIGGGLTVYLLMPGHAEERKEIAKEPAPASEVRADRSTGPHKKEIVGPETGLSPITQKPGVPRLTVKSLRTLGPLNYGVTQLAFDRYDNTLAAGGWTEHTTTAPWQAGSIVHPSTAEFKTAKSAGHWSSEIKVWDVATGKETAARTIRSRLQSLAFATQGPTLVIASDSVSPPTNPEYAWNWAGGCEAVRWDFAANKITKTTNDATMGSCPSLSRDGRLLACIPRQNRNEFHVWNVEAGKRLEVLHTPTYTFYPAYFSPDGAILAAWVPPPAPKSEGNGAVSVWRLVDGKRTSTFPVGLAPNEVETGGMRPTIFAFSGDSKILAGGFVGEFDKETVKLFDVTTGKSVADLDVLAGIPRNQPKVNSLAFSPDGKLLAVGLNTESKLWDVASGEAVATLTKDAVLAAAFSHDGRLLATGGADGRVTLWEITRN